MYTQGLVAGLGDYGYSPGQNVQLESRFPTEDTENSEMIGDLLQSGVDLLVTGGTAATEAAKQATSTLYRWVTPSERDWCRVSLDRAAT